MPVIEVANLTAHGYHPGPGLLLTDDRAIAKPEGGHRAGGSRVFPTELRVGEEDLETCFLRVIGADDA